MQQDPALRRVSSRRFQDHQVENEQRAINDFKKAVTNTFCCDLVTASIFLILIYTADPENCGDNIRGVLKFAVFLKFIAWYIYNYSILGLVIYKVITPKTGSILRIIGYLPMFYWYYYVLSKFFSESNDCKQVSKNLWWGLLILVIEAILVMIFMCLFC